jgi:hypothetical protein
MGAAQVGSRERGIAVGAEIDKRKTFFQRPTGRGATVHTNEGARPCQASDTHTLAHQYNNVMPLLSRGPSRFASRSAMRATGRVHFPAALASSRMTASTAIASVFKSLATSGGTTTVAARNRRPHNITPRLGAVLLVSSAIAIGNLGRRPPAEVVGTINGAKLGDVQNGLQAVSRHCEALDAGG